MTAAVATAMTLAAPTALASPTTPLDYKLTVIDPLLQGAASNQTANIIRDNRPELIVSSYAKYTVVAGEAILEPGSLFIYTNRSTKFREGAPATQTLDKWDKIEVFGPEENIVFPSQVKAADVDGDGDMDLMHGGGFFWDSNLGINRGSLTWWENRELPRTRAERVAYVRCLVNSRTWAALTTCIKGLQTWERHSIRTDSPGSYHDLDYNDLDGDGIKDIITTAEEGITKPSFRDDKIQMEFYKGLGGGKFAPVAVLADRGGSRPVVHDVDGDGDMDIMSAQYFNVSSVVRGPPAGDASFVWFENVGDGVPGMTAADFTKREISRGQGPSYGIWLVPNLFGDGQLRYIGVNHTNNTPGTPGPPSFLLAAPNVFLLTPGADIRAPWAATALAATVDPGASYASVPRPGQASPGKVMFNDLDKDGDIDLAVSGDGAYRGFIVEQTAPGVFHQSVLEESEGWGQAGISIGDYNLDGKTEIAMSSFENNKVGFWERIS